MELGGVCTFDHVFALAVQNACSALEILAAQPFRNSYGLWVWGAGVDRHLFALLDLTALLLLRRRGLLLGELLLLPLVVLEGLLLELVDILFERHACFFGVGFELLALPELELLGGHAALLRFYGHLLLDGCHLLWRGLLPWGWWGIHRGIV